MKEIDYLKRIASNPFYAIVIHPIFCEEHKPIVSEEEFIEVAVNLIKKEGAEKYIRNLLENLKGNYVVKI